MKKILLGFIAIGLLTFIGCEQDEVSTDSDTINTEANCKWGNGATDIDGNEYNTVIIGEQEWMAENLKVSKFNNGDTIKKYSSADPTYPVLEARMIIAKDTIICDSSHLENKFYNHHAFYDERKLCPDGWRIPSRADWDSLIDYLGGTEGLGKKLKTTGEEGTGLWEFPNENTNEVCFSVEPYGVPPFHNDCNSIGNKVSYFWSVNQSTSSSSQSAALFVQVNNNRAELVPFTHGWQSYCSVRCIKE